VVRHLPPEKPVPHGTEYRIRFTVGPKAAAIFGDDVATAHPGIIKNNRPRAERLLQAMQSGAKYEVWLEKRDYPGDNKWERIESEHP